MEGRKLSVTITLMLIIGIFAVVDLSVDVTRPGGAATLYVDKKGGADYTTINWAISEANDGDTIFVYNGTYYEYVLLWKRITLIGEDKYTTIIQGDGDGNTVNIADNGVKISGFTIRGSGYFSDEAGIGIDAENNVIISDNILTANDGKGIYIYDSSNINIYDNTIFGNDRGGIDLMYSNNINIYNNNFINNSIMISGDEVSHFNSHEISMNNTVNGKPIRYHRNTDGIDIENEPVGQVILANCQNINLTNLQINNTDTGIELAYSSDILLEGSTVSSNIDTGLDICFSSNVTLLDNIIKSNGGGGILFFYSSYGYIINNTVSLNDYMGISLSRSNNITITESTLIGNDRGIISSYSSDVKIYSNSITNHNFGEGIYVIGSNANITNNDIQGNNIGIDLRSSSNIIHGNNISSSKGWGIILTSCTNNTISNTNFTKDGIYIYGNDISHYNSHHIPDTNNVNGKPLYYRKNASGIDFNNISVGQLILVNCSIIDIQNLSIYNTTIGITILYSSNINISYCDISNNKYGVRIFNSSFLNMSGNILEYNKYYGYVLKQSSNNTIYRNNITGGSWGISLDTCMNNHVIMNNIFSQQYYGIYMKSSDNNFLIENNISFISRYGVYLELSSYNLLLNNSIFTITNQFTVNYGVYSISSSNNNLTKNTISSSDNYGIYMEESPNGSIINNTIVENEIGIYLLQSQNSILSDNTIERNDMTGIYLGSSPDSTIINNNIFSNGYYGICLIGCPNSSITRNSIYSNADNGIYVRSSYNYISANEINNNYHGIYLINSQRINITFNNFNDTYIGIYLGLSSNNTISCNNITFNSRGMKVTSSSNNIMFHNYFANNTQHADDDQGNNKWDNGYPCGGNFWSDYDGFDNYSGPNQDIPGSDGFGDTSYIIDSDSYDHYPIMASISGIGPRISLLSPINNSIIRPGFILILDIYDEDIYSTNYSIDNGVPQNFTSDYEINTSLWDEGIHTVLINATDMENNRNSRLYSFIIDSEKPIIILNSPGNNSIIPVGTHLNFSIEDIYFSYANYSINGMPDISLNNPFNILTINLTEGNYIIQINAVDLADNINSSWYTFTIDYGSPHIILNEPENNSIIPENTILDFSIIDISLLEANYSINGGANNSLLAPYNISTSGWSDGDYIIQINAIDSLSNSNSSWFFFTIDSIKPIVSLISPANNSLIPAGTVIDFSVTELHLLFINYTINGGVENPLSAPFDLDTAGWLDGDYTIQINAIDEAGNSYSSWYFFTVDSSPPIISLITPTNNSVIPDGTVLDFSVTDSNLDFMNYSVDGGPSNPFIDPYDISTAGWTDGDYTIQIEAVDIVGNSRIESFFITVDSIRPSIRLNSPANNTMILPGTLLNFNISDLHIQSVEFSINGGPNNPLPDPYDVSTSGWPDDNYIILINVIDEAGNANSSWYYFTIESSPPSIGLNTPMNNSVIVSGTTLDFAVSDPNLLEVNYSINGGTPIPLSDPYNISTTGWLDGDYIILINASDSIGNLNSLWFFFTLDSEKPEIILNSPLNNSVIREGTVIDLSIIDMTLDSVEYSIKGGPAYPLLPPFNISTSGWVDGDYIVHIDAYDFAGIHNSSWFLFTLDSTPPSIVFNSPGNNSFIPAGTVLDFMISDVHLDHANYSINGGADITLISPYNISSAGWSDGIYTIQVNALDEIGNWNSRWYTFTVDSTPPVTQFIAPGNNSVIYKGTTLDFEITDPNLLHVNYSVDGGGDIPLSTPFDISTAGWADDDYAIQINAVDIAGNPNSSMFILTIDSTDPEITLLYRGNNATIPNGTLLDISIVETNLLEANYSTNGGMNITLADPFDISTEGWVDGVYYVRINVVDKAENRHSILLEFTLDSTKPTIVLNEPPNNSLIQKGTTLDFTVNDTHLLHVNFSVNGGNRISISEPFEITADWLDGTYNIQFNAIDTAGNSNSTSIVFTLDSTPPTINIDSMLNHSTIPVGYIIEINISAGDLDHVSYSINEGEYVGLELPFVIDTSGREDGSYKITINASDGIGNKAIFWFEVKIDATMPSIDSTSPLHKSTEFDIDGSIIITFSEDMNQSGIESYLSISPATNFTYQWQSEDILRISFYTYNLTLGTTYNLTIDGAIMDANSNPMGTDFILTFTTKYLDSDGDGTPDIEDEDDDNDGHPDYNDTFPLDETEWQDFDGDGVGDNADLDDDDDGHPDSEDVFPYDPNRWREKEEPQPSNILPILVLIIAVIVVLLFIYMFVLRKSKEEEHEKVPEPGEKDSQDEESTEFVLEEEETTEPDSEEGEESEEEDVSFEEFKEEPQEITFEEFVEEEKVSEDEKVTFEKIKEGEKE